MTADRYDLLLRGGHVVTPWGVETADVAVRDGRIATLGDLRSHLARRGGVWEALGEGRNVRAAINQEMASPDKAVADRDEIAFFPPVTGG